MNYTHHLTHLNYAAIATAAGSYFVLGALWYSRAVFAKPWSKLVGLNLDDPNKKKGLALMMIGSFICFFILSTGMSFLAHSLHLQNWASGIRFGLITGVCFGLAVMSVGLIYERRPLTLYFIDGGYHLLGNIIVSIIVTVWK